VTHLPDLIQDLGLILMAAAITTILFKKLKQPIVLGYLIAGFFVGPHFAFFPSVKDSHNISVWAEIGVIFMLFGLGLEFSFKKLKKVGRSASITACFEIIFMLGAGYLLGQLLGWSKMDSLFLGGILSISSTTIIVRAFEELDLKRRSFASLVFGVLIVEDLIAIVLLVLLSSVAATQSLSGADLAFTAGRFGFFLVLWFLLGIYLLPILFKWLQNLLSSETTLIVSLGLCLMMVVVATNVGFSPALGAFVMGSLLAETTQGKTIEHLILPVKDLFAAVFFVSVGMMINPKILIDEMPTILLITAVTIVGKFLSSSIGALLSGKNLKMSVQTGMSLAQIGEFSFIIATLGITLKVTSEFLYPIAVAVSALTTFATPYLIKVSEGFYNWMDRRIPVTVKNSLIRYEATMSASSETHLLSLLWNEYGVKIVLNSVLVVAITITTRSWITTKATAQFGDLHFLNILLCLGTLVVCAPFLWAILAGKGNSKEVYSDEVVYLLSRIQIGILIFRFLVFCILTGFVISQFTSIQAISGLALFAYAAIGILLFSKYSSPIYKKIEEKFISNINGYPELKLNPDVQELAPWDANLVDFVLTPFSPFVGKTLLQSELRERFGVTLAVIERGSKRILAPTRHDQLFAGDKLFLIGTDVALSKVKSFIEAEQPEAITPISESFGLASLTVLKTDSFVGKSIRECGIRDTVNGLIVGVERDGKRILNPDSSMVLHAKDRIWIVGDKELIKNLRLHEKKREVIV